MIHLYVSILQKLNVSDDSCCLSIYECCFNKTLVQEPVLASMQNFVSLVTYKLYLFPAGLVRDFIDSVVFLCKILQILFFLFSISIIFLRRSP